MKVSDFFEPNGKGGVRCKRGVKIGSPPGPSATVNPPSEIGPLSSMGGANGKWILDNLANEAPKNWAAT